MPMPSSPPLIFPAHFVAEFPNGAGVPFGPAWCRGAGIVADTAANAAIPTSPPLNTLQFLGASRAAGASLPDSTVSQTQSGSPASAGIFLATNGNAYESSSGPIVGTWLHTPPATAYSARFTVLSQTGSGTFIPDTTWKPCGVAGVEPNWFLQQNVVGTSQVVGRLEFRLVATAVVISSAIITLNTTRL